VLTPLLRRRSIDPGREVIPRRHHLGITSIVTDHRALRGLDGTTNHVRGTGEKTSLELGEFDLSRPGLEVVRRQSVDPPNPLTSAFGCMRLAIESTGVNL
jgi:hypothetical protein